MLNWILIRTSRMLDWALVIMVVFALVYVCQFMVNFLTSPQDKNEE